MNRREFLRTAGGTTGVAAALGASGTAAAQENETAGNGTAQSGGNTGGDLPPPDFSGYLADANNYDGSVVDMTGQDEVTVDVGAAGGLAFGPAAVHVDNGATVVWEWTGEGGTHNVVSDGEGPLDSGTAVAEAGATYEYTFETDGIYNYYCNPHRSSGMLGSVVVGTDYPAVQQDGGQTPVNPEHVGVPFQAHWVGISTILAIFVSLLFSFYTLKYGESPNTKGGND